MSTEVEALRPDEKPRTVREIAKRFRVPPQTAFHIARTYGRVIPTVEPILDWEVQS